MGTTKMHKDGDMTFSSVNGDVSVVCAKSRFVILRLQTPWLRCLLVAGHAPHSGHTQDEIESWWSALSAIIPRAVADWPHRPPG